MWLTLTRTAKAKVAISWFFFVTGACLGNWAALLPSVKDEQDINNGKLGLILLAAVGGALIALPMITKLNNSYGSGRSTVLSGVMMVLFMPLVGITYNIGIFVVGVCMLGFVIGCLDVSANGQAVICEKMTREPTMGMFHCVYSIGAFSGAIIGGLIMEHDNSSVLKEVVMFSLILLVPGIILSPWLFSAKEEKLLMELHSIQFDATEATSPLLSQASNPLIERGENNGADHSLVNNGGLDEERENLKTGSDQEISNWKSYPSNNEKESNLTSDSWFNYQSYAKYYTLALIAFLALLACFGEGAVNDWSVIYFADDLDASSFSSTLGFAAFELSIAGGRFCSDHIVRMLGRRRLMELSGLLAAVGFTVVVVSPSLVSTEQNKIALQVLSIVGFSLAGLGLSSLAPSAISLAGSLAITKEAGVTSADAIATVTSVSYVGIMLSPPLLGSLSALFHSLRWSFLVAGAAVAPIALIAMCIKQEIFDSYHQGMSKQREVIKDLDEDTVTLSA